MKIDHYYNTTVTLRFGKKINHHYTLFFYNKIDNNQEPLSLRTINEHTVLHAYHCTQKQRSY